MKRILQIFIFALPLLSINGLFAQPGCPGVNIGNDTILPYGQTCANLHATVFSGFQSTAYTVSQIPYNPPFPYTAGVPFLVNQDDIFSDTIDLPFNFCFFGNTYNKIIVGANGIISFNINNADRINHWQIQGPLPDNYWPDERNCIMAPWQDVDPTNMGQTFYQIIGTYPCRMFEVSWYQVPYYGDSNSTTPPPPVCSPMFATQQVVIYETSNVIEIYIQNKGACLGWNNGLAIEGIQNDSATVAYTVPGRNATVWTAQNDAWRFTPAGNPSYSLAWFDNSVPISTADSVQVCTPVTHSYAAQAIYTNCDNTTITVTDTIVVRISDLSAQIDSFAPPLCSGTSTGRVYASFSTGTGPGVSSYGWTPGGANQTSLINIPAGTYVFSVTDSANHTISDTIILVDYPQLLVNVPDSVAYSCNAGNILGALTAYPTGGDTTGGNYSFTWSNTLASQTISGLPGGSYSVTVSDINGCTASDSGLVIPIFAIPAFNPPVIKNVSCSGGTDGSIIVSLNQSTPPITYSWSGGFLPNNDTVTGLSQGIYLVTAIDANGCSATASDTINQPLPLSIVNPVITQATCLSGGTICVTVSGGSGIPTYSWSNGDSVNCIDSLVGSSYSLTVTDQNLCATSATYPISAPPQVSFGTPSIVNVSCNESNNGRVTASAIGGTGPITYAWNNLASGPIDSNLTAGIYSVTITDINGCSASVNYRVNEPPLLAIDSSILTVGSCRVGGSITVYASGGTAPLIYSWSNGQSGNPQTGLAPGSYTLTITDQNLCSITDLYSVSSTAVPVGFRTPAIMNVSCFGDSTGSIAATDSGGTGPITFHWNYQNDTTATISSVPAGSYSVTITDTAGCSATTTYTVSQPIQIIPNLTYSSLICFGAHTGNACISPAGGTPGYTYTWNTADTSICIAGQPRGKVVVTITDASNCTVKDSAIIKEEPQLSFSKTLNLHSCTVPAYGDLSLVVRGGIGTVLVNIPGIGTDTVTRIVGDSIAAFPHVAVGNYTFTLTDSLGCTTSDTFSVPQGPPSDTFNIKADSTTCFSFQDGAIKITGASPNGPYAYSLNGGSFGNDSAFISLPAGVYNVTVKNSYGCLHTVTDTVGQPLPVSANANPHTIVTAPGVDNPITVTVQNFNNPVYTWTPSQGLSCANCDTPLANVNAATVFYVTVSEAEHSNCNAFDSVVITVTGQFTMPNAFTPNGDGKNDLFGPVKEGLVTIQEFRIYNRWGELVHNNNDYWDGTYGGKEEPVGTYVYYIRVQTPDRNNPGASKTEKRQGSFSLIR